METKKIEIEIDMKHLSEVSYVFAIFMQENLEEIRESYIGFLSDKNTKTTEAETPFPTFCFHVFLFELKKSFEEDGE